MTCWLMDIDWAGWTLDKAKSFYSRPFYAFDKHQGAYISSGALVLGGESWEEYHSCSGYLQTHNRVRSLKYPVITCAENMALLTT